MINGEPNCTKDRMIVLGSLVFHYWNTVNYYYRLCSQNNYDIVIYFNHLFLKGTIFRYFDKIVGSHPVMLIVTARFSRAIEDSETLHLKILKLCSLSHMRIFCDIVQLQFVFCLLILNTVL